MTRTLTAAVLAALLVFACAADDKGPEDDVPEVGEGPGGAKDDSQLKPTDHGALAFGATATASVSATAGFHAWQFELHGEARVRIATARVPHYATFDTVLYLYKHNGTSWGAYLVRSDDVGTSRLSVIERALGAGRYRILVKGHTRDLRGRFAVSATCNGAGCELPPPPPSERCLLADSYRTLLTTGTYVTEPTRVVRSASQLDGQQAAQVLDALRATYPDAADLTAALARADGGTVNVTMVVEQTTNSDLFVVEHGAGDTSVGAVYFGRSLVRAAVISDGAVEQCTLLAPRAGVTLALGEACRAPSECGAGVNCVGQFAGLGKCAVTRTRPAGDGAECADDAGCGAGLVCAGATRGYGMCNSAWMRGSFSSAASRALPARATVAERIVVRGLATVDTDVLLSATIRHPRPGDLTVTLSNPASAELPVLGAVTATGWSFSGVVGGFSGDESVNGEWTLRITDRAGAVTDGGTLDGATLTITSRWD